MQDGGPELHHLASDLARAVKATKCDVSPLQVRGGRDRGIGAWMITADGARQPVHSFGEQVLGSWTRHLGIAQKIIHGRHAGGAYHAYPGNLHWSGLTRERQVSPAGGMPGQVHQNVDPIGADALRQVVFLWREGHEVVYLPSDPVRDLI